MRAAAALCASLLLLGDAACNGPIPLDVMLDRGATLRVHGAPPTSLDPALVSDSVSWSYLIQIFSGLVRLDDRLEVVPDLAERWELSPDRHLTGPAVWHRPHRRGGYRRHVSRVNGLSSNAFAAQLLTPCRG